ncbi:hypothetical protein SAMN02745178_01966 [Gemmiger formicilis]|uniref:Uncharacterized protein n=1 Tax=Gemmiger formicilis TaxID=745368 RepID=A0A1T4XL12_9FIRM|nr:hypothetical protein SAMN02745178_01966 [Gemmiger formicilis]
MPTKERTKENCRCCDAADPRLRGCTPLRTPIRKSEGAGAKRKQYYFSFLTPPPLPPPLSRVFPRTPAGGRGRPPCQRGLSPLGDWGIPAGLAWPPVTPADGQESLRLACARHLPLTREALLAGSARAKGSPLRGELAAPAGLRGFVGFSAAARHPFAAQSTPNSSLLTPPLSLSQNFTNFTRATQNLPPLCKTFTAIVQYYGRNRRKTAVQLACFR